MPIASNQEELQKYISWFKLSTGNTNTCQKIWTPITDQEEEGIWRSMESGELVDFLPFDRGQPNSGESDNYITIVTNKMPTPYNDLNEKYRYCFSCNLQRSSVLHLWGVCRDSYLGNR